MKVAHAARFTALIFFVACCVTLLYLRPGLRVVGVQFPRQGWVLEHPTLWQAGGWLWILTSFGWLWLLTTLAWRYLPAQRLVAMLQSGLLLMGATLTITGVITWLSGLPVAMAQADAGAYISLVDGLALGLLGGGGLIAGVVTAWIGIDLWRQQVLARQGIACCILAGCCTIPSPLLFPWFYHLLPAALFWWLWTLYLAFLPRRSRPFTE